MGRKMSHEGLPNSWMWARLGDVADPVREHITPTYQPEREFNYLSIENVESNTGRLVGFHPTPGKDIKSAKFIFSTKDVLYSKLRPYLNKVHIPSFDGVSATDLLPLRPREGVSREYLAYFLRTRDVVEYANQRTRGIQLPRVTVDDLLSLRVPVPPSREQERIVARINQLFVKLQVARESLQKVPLLMQQFRQSLLEKAFRGELSNHQPDDRIVIDHVTHDDPFARLTDLDKSDFPDLAEGWRWVSVDDIAEVRLGRQRSPGNRSDKFPRKYIRAANIKDGALNLADVKDMDFKPNEFEIYKLRKGDVLLSEGSGSKDEVGKCAIWNDEIPDCCLQNTVIRVRSSLVPSKYLFYAFQNARLRGDFSRIVKGIEIFHLGAERLASYPIPLAPNQEMNDVIERIDGMLSVVGLVSQSVVSARETASQLEQSILAKAFCGELVPQDPNDEPAAILLDRIRSDGIERVSSAQKLMSKGRSR